MRAAIRCAILILLNGKEGIYMEKNIEQMNNKQFIYTCLESLRKCGGLNEDLIRILTDPEECRALFQCSFSVIQEVPLNCTEINLTPYCYDDCGRQRYYKNIITICGKSYVPMNHWYGPGKSNPDNRTPFLSWVKKMSNQLQIP